MRAGPPYLGLRLLVTSYARGGALVGKTAMETELSWRPAAVPGKSVGWPEWSGFPGRAVSHACPHRGLVRQ